MDYHLSARAVRSGLDRLTGQQRRILAELARWKRDELIALRSHPDCGAETRGKIDESCAKLQQAADILEERE